MSRNVFKYTAMFALLVSAAFIGGCGSDSRDSGASLGSVAKVSEAACAQCHGSSVNQQSGKPIYSEYIKSKHFSNSLGEVIGCQDCHGGGAIHNGVGPMPFPNPDKAGKCWGCHQTAFLGTYEPGGVATAVEKAHFKNMTGYRTLYVNLTGADTFTCTGCHEPHNPLSAEDKAWAASGHGNVAGAAWVPSSSHKWRISGGSENFSTTLPASDCVRCHTSEGFVQFATGSSPFTSIANLPSDLPGATKVNSPLNCKGCHFNDSFAVRGVSAVSTAYNATGVDASIAAKPTVAQSRIAAKFPDVGQSNICIACHSGRVSGPNLTAMFATGTWDLSKTSFVNSHYMAAAGTMYMEVGFKNFTTLTAPAPKSNEGATFASTQTYNQTLSALNTTTPDGIAGGQNSAHRRVGTPLIAGSETYLPAGGSAIATNGPCVTCHMKAYDPIYGNGFTPPAAGRPANGHSLQIDDATAQQLCLQCHADAPHLDGGTGTGTGLYTTMKNINDMEAAMIEPQSTAFQNGLALIKQILKVKYMIDYDGTAYPYFFDLNKGAAHTSANAVTDWTRSALAGSTNAAVTALGNANITVIPNAGLTQLQAYRLMGACYNLNVLARDPGAYLHARTYTQRLVYDTVDYIDNNLMDFTALSTARTVTTVATAVASASRTPLEKALAGTYTGYDVNVLNPTPGVGLGGAGLATESMAWLAGTHYTDTKGTTATPLRLRP